jgi:hypothetical protein
MKTKPVQELMLQAWWSDAMIYSDQFFDMTVSISMNTNADDVAARFNELQMIRSSFEQADFPPFVASARQCLLKGMAEVLLSFQEFFSGNADIARVYMSSAQTALQELENEVYRLGLPKHPTNERLH